MSHARQQIALAVMAKLVAGDHDSVGVRVYEETGRPLEKDEVGAGCIVVHTGDEQIEADMGGKLRSLDLKVIAGAPAGDSAQTTANALIAFIEQTLDDGVQVGANWVDFLPGSIKTDLAAETDRRVVAAAVGYRAVYRTAFNQPEALL